jgi:hypothetical protein
VAFFRGLKMANPSLGGPLIPVWFYFWRISGDKKHAKRPQSRYIYSHFQSKF